MSYDNVFHHDSHQPQRPDQRKWKEEEEEELQSSFYLATNDTLSFE